MESGHVSSLPANLENSVAFTRRVTPRQEFPNIPNIPIRALPLLFSGGLSSRRAAHTAARFLQTWLLHPAHLGSSPPGLLPLPLRHPARQSGLRSPPGWFECRFSAHGDIKEERVATYHHYLANEQHLTKREGKNKKQLYSPGM